MSKQNSFRLLLLILSLVAVLLVPVILFDSQIEAHFSGDAGVERLRSFGGWAWCAGIMLIVSDLALPVPSTAVIAGLGMIYGPWLGGLIGGLGSMLAGFVAYAGCRLLGRRVASYLAGEANMQRMAGFFGRHGLWAIALSRWMPLLPELLCCLAGVSRMRMHAFLASLACGSLAMGFVFANLGMAYLDRPVLGLALSAAVPLLVWPPLHLLLTRQQLALAPVENR